MLLDVFADLTPTDRHGHKAIDLASSGACYALIRDAAKRKTLQNTGENRRLAFLMAANHVACPRSFPNANAAESQSQSQQQQQAEQTQSNANSDSATAAPTVSEGKRSTQRADSNSENSANSSGSSGNNGSSSLAGLLSLGGQASDFSASKPALGAASGEIRLGGSKDADGDTTMQPAGNSNSSNSSSSSADRKSVV